MKTAHLLLVPLCLGLALPGAGQVPEYELKAEFLERFTRFIEWPSPASEPGPFVIGAFEINEAAAQSSRLAISAKLLELARVVRAGDGRP